MRASRWLTLALVFALALPAALAAARACGMVDCAMGSAAQGHDCCPEPEARIESDCCEHGDAAPAQAPTSARERAPAPAVVVPATPVLAAAAERLDTSHPPAPAASPPGDLHARHCVLRI
jgi:hypothetical protein